MRIKVSSPNHQLKPTDIDDIERDLEKIDRRLHDYREEVLAEVRITGNEKTPQHHVTIELHYGRNHLIAKTDHADMGQAVRAAREDLLRQINDRSRGGHSSFAKGL
jgi:ribosome-associated translation inhibitor RaiA